MKKVIYSVAILFALSACNGESGDGAYVGPFTLSVDKVQVEASGKDYATFKLMDANGRDILVDRAGLEKVNINSEEGIRVPRMQNKTVFIANGTYNFTATYDGKKSENIVQVEAVNRGVYEKFHKNVALYKATGTWCPNCPAMTKAIDNMNEDAKNHSVVMCWHGQDEAALKFQGSANDCGTLVAAHISGTAAFPTALLDLQKSTTSKSSSLLESYIWDLRAEYPATCGIKASAVYEGGKVKVSAELTSSTGGEYDLASAVLLHNCELGGAGSADGKYSHIVYASTGNFLTYNPNTISKVAKEAKLPYEQSFDIANADVDNLSAVVFALVKEGNGARIDNIIEVKLGGSVDYVYNE